MERFMNSYDGDLVVNCSATTFDADAEVIRLLQLSTEADVDCYDVVPESIQFLGGLSDFSGEAWCLDALAAYQEQLQQNAAQYEAFSSSSITANDGRINTSTTIAASQQHAGSTKGRSRLGADVPGQHSHGTLPLSAIGTMQPNAGGPSACSDPGEDQHGNVDPGGLDESSYEATSAVSATVAGCQEQQSLFAAHQAAAEARRAALEAKLAQEATVVQAYMEAQRRKDEELLLSMARRRIAAGGCLTACSASRQSVDPP